MQRKSKIRAEHYWSKIAINPLPEFTKESNLLLTGTFEAVLVGCEVIERPKFEDPSQWETALKFLFEIPAEEVVLAKIDGLKFGKQSNLRRDLQLLTGPGFSTEVLSNQDVLWEHIQSLLGRRYSIVCELSEGGTYTKITNIVPLMVSGQRVNGHGVRRAAQVA